MRAIAIGQDGETKLAISIPEEESRITGNTATVSKVTIAVTHFSPPGQAEPRSFISPDSFNATFELIVLARHHLLDCRFANESLAFEHSTIEIANQPVCLVQHGSIDKPSRPNGSFHSHCSDLATGFFIDDIRNRQ